MSGQWTVVCRQQGFTRAQVGHVVTHEYRMTAEHNGKLTEHSNESIDPERTSKNQDFIFVDGQMRKLKHTSQIFKELDQRIENASGIRVNKKTGKAHKIAVRKDAKVVRGVMLQIDPKFTGTVQEMLADPEKTDRVYELLQGLIDHCGDEYGRHNLLSASLHLDEKSPHVHLMLTPIDEKGRFRQASFIKDQKGMRDWNTRARNKMRSMNFDAQVMTINPDAVHKSVEELKRETLTAADKLASVEEELEPKTGELAKKREEADVFLADAKEVSAQANAQLAINLDKEDELDEREMKLSRREKELEEKLAQYEIDNSTLKIREGEARNLGYAEGIRLAKKDIEEREEKARKAIEEAQAVKDSANAVVADAQMMRDAFTRVNKKYKAHAPAWFTPEEIKTINSNLQVAKNSSVKLRDSSLMARQAQSRLSQAQSDLEL